MSYVTTTGAGHADLATAPVTAPPFTLAAWIKISALGAVQQYVTVGTSGSANNRYSLRKGTTDLIAAEEMDTVSSTSATTLTIADLDTWHLGVATFVDHSTRPCFVDGGYKSSTTAARTVSGVNCVRLSGTPTSGSPMAGLMSCAAIWNVALNESEIALLYGSRMPFGNMRREALAFWVPRMGYGSAIVDVVGGVPLIVTAGTFSPDEPAIGPYQRKFYTLGSLRTDTGTGSPTESSDAVSGVGTVSVAGTSAITEGADTVAGVGTDSVSGISALTEGADTVAGVGAVSVSGVSAATEDADTVAGIGSVNVSGISAATEDSDTSTGAGTHGVQQASGGFSTAYERQISRSRSRRDRERQAAEEALENAQDDEVQAELARYLHAQLAKQAEMDDLQRLKRLVGRQALDRTLPDKVQVALAKAQQDASYSRLQALEREYRQMLEEEELALLMTLSLLD